MELKYSDSNLRTLGSHWEVLTGPGAEGDASDLSLEDHSSCSAK